MRQLKILCSLLSLALLSACGGGGGGSSSGSGSTSTTPDINVVGASVNQQQASRFLAQASFGANSPSIDEITSTNVETWIERQFAKPQTMHLNYVNQILAGLPAGQTLSENNFFESFWKQAATADDQLRQRVTFALSQIFVISFDSVLSGNARTVASYYDTLGSDAFGNFRTLLNDVTLHPAMGQYLTYLANQKESGTRTPDENYARELMQLFTIGLYQLNTDGSQQLSGGKPIETYTNADVSGMAKVFTGWSWGGADKTSTRFFGGTPDPNRDVIPMQSYPSFHSISTKTFLGVTIAAQTTANTEGDLKIALDTLFNHPNAGPFIGRQLIQRLVMSNPSPAYVARVATAFNNNGSGVRGDMKAVIRAVLLDTEARDATLAQGATYGKLREPVVRLGNWMRAFGATASSGRFAVGNTDNGGTALGQSPIRSSSVFNFYRPGYVPPNTNLAASNLVSPEMQITQETSVAGYLNYMQNVIPNGAGSSTGQAVDKVVSVYVNEIALADNPTQLVDRVNLLLLANEMKAATRTQIISAVSGITVRTDTPAHTDADHKNRVYLAVFLAMATPEYIVQK